MAEKRRREAGSAHYQVAARVGKKRAISSKVTRPSKKAPIVANSWRGRLRPIGQWDDEAQMAPFGRRLVGRRLDVLPMTDGSTVISFGPDHDQAPGG
jgi:hypothetical protein